MADLNVPRAGNAGPEAIPPMIKNNGGKPKVDKTVKRPQVSNIELQGLSENEIKELAASREAVSDRIAEINAVLRSARKEIRFRLPDGGSEDPVIVEVIDPGTEEIIRTIPSDALLRVKNQLEVMMGLVFDSEA
ncbi:MAG: flagellar protein FlaG [Planctomycetota bacterium]|jgi:uncharacterized FlaG/YvyC family protein